MSQSTVSHECRDMGHTWHSYTVRYDRKLRVYIRILQCKRCTTRRTQHVSKSGKMTTTSYKYPQGYLFTDDNRLSKEDIRLANIKGEV